VLGFYPESGAQGNGNDWRAIRVELARRGLEVRACQGYLKR